MKKIAIITMVLVSGLFLSSCAEDELLLNDQIEDAESTDKDESPSNPPPPPSSKKD